MAFILSLAFVTGCAGVISRMINYRCTKFLGPNNGSLINYVIAAAVSLILLLVTSRFHYNPYRFVQAPWYLYLGGAFGVIAFLITMRTQSHLKVMESTILQLAGQLTTGILFDTIIFKNINLQKLFGIALVAAGIIWDNKITSSNKQQS